MAKKKNYISLDDFLNQNPEQRVQKEEKVFPETTLNNRNLGAVPDNVPGLPTSNPIPQDLPQTNITPKIRNNKNRGGKRNLRKFKKVERSPDEAVGRPIDTKNFRFPYAVEGMPADISPEELRKARKLLPKQNADETARSVIDSKGNAVNASQQEIVSPKRGKNRGGRGKRGRPAVPHMSHGQPITPESTGFFTPEKVVNKNGKIRYVNPNNKRETIYTVGKNGKRRWVNSRFVVDPFDNVARIADGQESFLNIQNLFLNNTPRADAESIINFLPRPVHGVAIEKATRNDVLGDINEALRIPTKASRAEFDHRQAMRRKYNDKRRPDNNTRSTAKERARKKAAGVFDYGEDQGNTFNIERRRHTVGRHAGSVGEYKAKVAQYIRELEIELSYLDAGKKKATRRIIIEDTLKDLRAELRKTADQINPTKTGLPHKLELKVIEALKEEGKVLNFMVGDISNVSKEANFLREKSLLSEIANSKFSVLSRMDASMLKADMMQEYLQPSTIKGHLKNINGIERYMRGDRIDEFVIDDDYYLGTSNRIERRYPRPGSAETRLRRPGGKIRVGKQVIEDRKLQAVQEKEMQREARRAQRILENDPDISNFSAYKDRVNQYREMGRARVQSRTIQQTPQSAAAGVDNIVPPARTSSRIANIIGEDTVRAASVIHSSKMGYAAAGVAAIAGVFGFASASRHKRNIEQEMQGRR